MTAEEAIPAPAARRNYRYHAARPVKFSYISSSGKFGSCAAAGARASQRSNSRLLWLSKFQNGKGDGETSCLVMIPNTFNLRRFNVTEVSDALPRGPIERLLLPNAAGLLFAKGGQRICPMCLRRALRRACKQAKIANFTFHDLRHCAISNWHTLGVPVSVAMRMAGHSSVQSHKKYVNLGTQEVISVVEKLFPNCSQEKTEPSRTSASS